MGYAHPGIDALLERVGREVQVVQRAEGLEAQIKIVGVAQRGEARAEGVAVAADEGVPGRLCLRTGRWSAV